MAASGWESSVTKIERGGTRCRRRSYAVVAAGEHPKLVEERRNRYREKREEIGEWERREKKKWRERREKREYKTIKFLQNLSVPLQICNSTVAMLYNFWDLTHLINLHFCVWCGKCTKYLTFGTFATPAVDALSFPTATCLSASFSPDQSSERSCISLCVFFFKLNISLCLCLR